MKVLLVSNQRRNLQGIGNPIMYRMCDALAQVESVDKVSFLPFANSFSSLKNIRYAAKDYDIVHIHFGGLYTLLIWVVLIGVSAKKIITFHGTDIHAKALKTTKSFLSRIKILINQLSSFLSIWLFDKCGFVSVEMKSYVPNFFSHQMRKKSFIQPLGVNYDLFKPIEKTAALNFLGLGNNKRYVLFSNVSNTNIKRQDIAEAIVHLLGEDYSLLIMCGVKPQDVPYYICASDFVLLTSDEEGSPNIIREALSLNKPVFSVAVGDAEKQLYKLNNSAIISRTPEKAVKTIQSVLNKQYIDNSRDLLQDRLDFVRINRKIVQEVYSK